MTCPGKPEKDYPGVCDTCWGCSQCHGCTDDTCRGCDRRWCSGAYMGQGCDRCPEKVHKTIKSNGKDIEIKVRCNGTVGHDKKHHWDPWQAER